jgi:hypothetical protein
MFDSAGFDDARVAEFEKLEREMTALYQADRTKPQAPTEEEAFDEDEPVFKVESTG